MIPPRHESSPILDESRAPWRLSRSRGALYGLFAVSIAGAATAPLFTVQKAPQQGSSEQEATRTAMSLAAEQALTSEPVATLLPIAVPQPVAEAAPAVPPRQTPAVAVAKPRRATLAGQVSASAFKPRPVAAWVPDPSSYVARNSQSESAPALPASTPTASDASAVKTVMMDAPAPGSGVVQTLDAAAWATVADFRRLEELAVAVSSPVSVPTSREEVAIAPAPMPVPVSRPQEPAAITAVPSPVSVPVPQDEAAVATAPTPLPVSTPRKEVAVAAAPSPLAMTDAQVKVANTPADTPAAKPITAAQVVQALVEPQAPVAIAPMPATAFAPTDTSEPTTIVVAASGTGALPAGAADAPLVLHMHGGGTASHSLQTAQAEPADEEVVVVAHNGSVAAPDAAFAQARGADVIVVAAGGNEPVSMEAELRGLSLALSTSMSSRSTRLARAPELPNWAVMGQGKKLRLAD